MISDESTIIHHYPCLKSINSTLGSGRPRLDSTRRATLPHHEGSPESNHDVRRELSGFAKQRRARARARRAQDDGECDRYPAVYLSVYTYLSLFLSERGSGSVCTGRTDDGRRHGLERVTSLRRAGSAASFRRRDDDGERGTNG